MPPRNSAPTHADPFDPDQIVNEVERLPDRTIFYAPEKWGKTSFAAQADGVVFAMTKGEDGLKTLISSRQLPRVPHYPRTMDSWIDVLKVLDTFIVKNPGYRAFALDVLNGCQRLLFEHVCAQAPFNGRWAVFEQFAAGPKAAQTEWLAFLARLDRIRELGVAVWCLAHASAEKVPNPDGPEFERWQPALDRKYIWPLTQRWADLILFGGFDIYVEGGKERGTKAKATGGTQRVLYCQPRATVAAGNRHGLPAEIALGDSAEQAWQDFQTAFPQSQ